KLRGGIILFGPGLAAVDRDVSAAVVGLDHALRIVRIDPQVMVITVSRTQLSIGLAAVRRFKETNIEDIDSVAAFRIGKNVSVVNRSLTEPPVFAHFGP